MIKLYAILIIASLLFAHNGLGKGSLPDPDLKKRQEMIDISRQLGVTCTHCHDVKNLRSGKKRTHKIALEHMRITKWLDRKGFKGKPKGTCYMCHRGQPVPDYKEPKGNK